MPDHHVIFQRRAGKPVEMQAVDLYHVGCFPERLLHIAIFENTVPDFVRAGFFMQNALVGQRLFRIHHRIQSLILHIDKFGGIVGNLRRLRDNCHDRFTLITNFGNAQWIVANLGIRSNLDERLRLGHYFLPRKRANDSGQRVSR